MSPTSSVKSTTPQKQHVRPFLKKVGSEIHEFFHHHQRDQRRRSESSSSTHSATPPDSPGSTYKSYPTLALPSHGSEYGSETRPSTKEIEFERWRKSQSSEHHVPKIVISATETPSSGGTQGGHSKGKPSSTQGGQGGVDDPATSSEPEAGRPGDIPRTLPAEEEAMGVPHGEELPRPAAPPGIETKAPSGASLGAPPKSPEQGGVAPSTLPATKSGDDVGKKTPEGYDVSLPDPSSPGAKVASTEGKSGAPSGKDLPDKPSGETLPPRTVDIGVGTDDDLESWVIPEMPESKEKSKHTPPSPSKTDEGAVSLPSRDHSDASKPPPDPPSRPGDYSEETQTLPSTETKAGTPSNKDLNNSSASYLEALEGYLRRGWKQTADLLLPAVGADTAESDPLLTTTPDASKGSREIPASAKIPPPMLDEDPFGHTSHSGPSASGPLRRLSPEAERQRQFCSAAVFTVVHFSQYVSPRPKFAPLTVALFAWCLYPSVHSLFT